MADDEYVSLNMNHPLNKHMAEAIASMTRSQLDKWLVRQTKRMTFDVLLDLDPDQVMYPRSRVLRMMVICFKAGHQAGDARGWRACERRARKLAARRAKDGR
jgi:hypothetical protein